MAAIFTHQFIRTQKVNQFKQTISNLEKQIQDARTFIKEIELGNLEIDLQVQDDCGLAASLLSMRDQMKKIAQDEKRRNWTSEGLARFVDILRSSNDDVVQLGNGIINNIVKYMNANQGSLFILDDSDSANVHLNLIACYAFDRKKHIEKKIGVGEGLLGQCVLEKSTMHMTNLPKDYLKITSGLGEAMPKHLLIVPLLLNDIVYGVIEIASFSAFEKHHRDFIEKLAESIASTISNTRVNEQTKTLLRETQAQAEMMRSQEEEMRQNLEELAATQEEMQRILKEVESKQVYLDQLLNVSVDSIFTIDKSYKLVSWNKAFAATLEKFGLRLHKGLNTLDWYQGEQKKEQIAIYNRVLRGESFEMTASSEQEGKTLHHLSIYAPLRDTNGDVFEAAVFAKDVSAMINARQEAEKMAAEAQEKTEEMKAQEEEIRQSIEELSATQDEMQRILNEVQSREAYLNALLNSSKDSIFTVDRDLRLVSFNEGFAAGLTQVGLKVEKGFSVLDLFPSEEQKATQQSLFKRAFNGESCEQTSEYDYNGVISHYNSAFSPLKNEKNEVYEVAVFGKDLTELVNAKTKAERMAAEAQEKTEEMKAQEEEIRQSIEELSATQDEMHRILGEVQSREAYLNSLINATKDSIFTVDKDLKIISFNESFGTSLKQVGIDVDKGVCALDIFPDPEQKSKQKAFYDRAFSGESFDVTNEYDYGGVISYYNSAFSPLRNERNEVYAVSVFGKDLTELITSRNAAQRLAYDAQEKTEEMKAQEEELRQNLEELAATQDEMERVMNQLEKKNTYTMALLDASDDVVFTIDRELRLVTWNAAFEKMMKQYGQSVAKGFNTLDWYPEETQRKQQIELYNRVFAGESFSSNFTTENNGSKVNFRNSYKPLVNDGGEVYEAVLFTRNVTDAQHDDSTKGSMTMSQARPNTFVIDVINSSKNIVVTLDKNGRVLYFNPACEKMIQSLGTHVAIGLPVFFSISDKTAVKAIRANLGRVFKGEAIVQVQELRHGNTSTYLWAHYTPLKNENGEIVAVGIYGEDVTELVTLKETNSLLMKRLENQN